jgi:hypothetical protein
MTWSTSEVGEKDVVHVSLWVYKCEHICKLKLMFFCMPHTSMFVVCVFGAWA